jgi:hypothetical protein
MVSNRYVPSIKFAGWLFTFFIVTLAWVFFRAENLNVALDMLTNALFITTGADWLTIPWHSALLIPLFIVFDHFIIETNVQETLKRWSWQQRWITYGFLLFCLINLSGAQAHPFIYFRF